MDEHTSSRRALLALGAGTITVGTAGCIDQIPFVGDQPLEFDASPASIPDATLTETGYEEDAIEESVIEETFEAAGQTQDVIVTNWQSEYDKEIDLGQFLPTDETVRAAVVTILTTPQVSVLGETFNPVADMDNEELAMMVQDQFEGLDELEHIEDVTAPVAGTSTTVGEFEGEATLVEVGIAVDLRLHVAEPVESGDDFIIAVGGYPVELHEQERPHVFSMFEAVEHDG